MSYTVTFYSYKGGVGRTLTLVNVAVSLVRLGHSVFIWELDLEAPGLLHMPFFAALKAQASGGAVDLLAAYPHTPPGHDLARYVLDHPDFAPGRLRLLPAGRADARYAERFAAIRWDLLFAPDSTMGSEVFELMRQEIDKYNADFLLIDSRTGLTDVGAICTVQLPHTVVLVYNLSHQSLEGTRHIQVALSQTDRLKEVRRQELKILRVACPVPAEWPDLAAQRREATQALGPVERAGRRKQELQEAYNLTPHVEIPFQSSLLLEERIWTQDFPDTPLAKAYDSLARRLSEAVPRVAPRAMAFERGHGFEALFERHGRGKTLGDKTAEIVRLMGFEVGTLDQQDAIEHFVASKTEPFQEITLAVVCQDSPRLLSAADLQTCLDRLGREPGQRGLVVARAGWTEEAMALAQTAQVLAQSYDALLASLVDLRDYVRLLLQDYEGQEIERLYVEPRVWPETAEAPLLLADYITQWLDTTEQPHLTLLGDYGTGKTWFTRRLAATLAQRWQDDPRRQRLPLRIDLRDVSKALNLDNILYDHLQRQAGRLVDPKAVRYLLAEGRLVLIFDGFDEMATQANWQETLDNFRELARAAEGQAKVILTCRTHYFKAQSQVQAMLAGERPPTSEGTTELYREVQARQGFGVAHLLEFDAVQIDDYLQRACGPRADEVADAIQRLSGLREIAARPVLLDMIVKSAPQLDQSGGAVKVADLYEIYTESWLARQDWRLRLTRDGRTAMVEELAARLWDTDSARIHYRELAEVLSGLLKERLSTDRDLEIADYEVRTASFLTRDAEGHYGFSHRSFLEFFLARRLARLLREAAADAGRAVEALRCRLLSNPVLAFVRDLLAPEALTAAIAMVLDGPYTRFSSENALLLYATLRPPRVALQGLELAGAHLAGMTLAACDLTHANLAEADLTGSDLTGVNLTQARLGGANLTRARLAECVCVGSDFHGACLVGACLDGGQYAGADFSAADLSFATLIGAQMQGARLAGTAVDGASFYGAALDTEQWAGTHAVYAPDPVRFDPGELTPIIQTGPGWVRSLAYSPDGKLLALAAQGNAQIRLVDLATGQCRRVLSGHTAGVTALGWRADGQQLASGAEDGTVRLWAVGSGQVEHTLAGHDGAVLAVAYRGDGQQLASGAEDGTVRLWAVGSGQVEHTLAGHHGAVWAVAYRGDGQQLASGAEDGTVRLWAVGSGQVEHTLAGPSGAVWAVAYRGDGQQLASGGSDGTVRLWAVGSGQVEHTLAGHHGAVWVVAYRGDGQQLASGARDGTVRLWAVGSGQVEHTLAGHDGSVWAVAYRGDGQQLASGAEDGTVRLWAVGSGQVEHTLAGPSGAVLAVAYRGDGQQLASGARDGTVRLWAVASGQVVCLLQGSTGIVKSLAWSPDGQRLVSASSDGSMRLWDTASGRCLVTLYQFSGGGWLALTPQGRYTGNALGKRQVTLAHGWALYPADMFPMFDDPEAVRAALAPSPARRRRQRQP